MIAVLFTRSFPVYYLYDVKAILAKIFAYLSGFGKQYFIKQIIKNYLLRGIRLSLYTTGGKICGRDIR
ncbi:MAG: hypothetical protein DRP51_03485 [Candidatus Zixiibacteriota bacterium]|nr:MAG: hypothetical protein DRP51_03485 [candidate division Zixibacteria bacterium]